MAGLAGPRTCAIRAVRAQAKSNVWKLCRRPCWTLLELDSAPLPFPFPLGGPSRTPSTHDAR